MVIFSIKPTRQSSRGGGSLKQSTCEPRIETRTLREHRSTPQLRDCAPTLGARDYPVYYYRLYSSSGAFEDDDVTHVEGDVNPVRDLDIISEELRLKDVEFLNVHLEKLEKLVIRGNDKKLKPEYVSLPDRLLFR